MPDHGHKHPWAPRIEDAPLLRGRGRFQDDIHAPNQAAAAFLRSPHAHARLMSIDTTKAEALPGVLAVLTAKDIAAAGAGTISHPLAQIGRGGRTLIAPPRPALAEDRALHVGHPIMLIVAETQDIAQDAMELIEIDYEALPAGI